MKIELPAKVHLEIAHGKPAKMLVEVKLHNEANRNLMYINIDDAINGENLVEAVAKYVGQSHPGNYRKKQGNL